MQNIPQRKQGRGGKGELDKRRGEKEQKEGHVFQETSAALSRVAQDLPAPESTQTAYGHSSSHSKNREHSERGSLRERRAVA